MAIDITISHYSDGTATVAGVNVTGQGTAWSKLRKGDLYGTHLGFAVRIAEVIDDTHLTLAHDVPALYQIEAAYEIQRTPHDLGYLQGIQDLLEKLGNGNLESFAGLAGLADRLPMFTGPGELSLVSKIDLSAGLKSDGQSPDQAGLAAFEDENAGFIVRVADYLGGRAALVEKLNNGAPAVWSAPSYITGPAITLDITEVDDVPYGEPPDVTLTPRDGGYDLAFAIPRGMLIEPGTTTTLPPGSDAVVNFVPVTGGYRLDISLPKGDTGDIDGVTPFWVSRLSTDVDAEDALTGLGVTPFWQSRILSDVDAAAAREGLGAGDVVGPAGATAKRLAVFGTATGKLLAEASGLTLAEQGRARADIGADVLGGFRNKIINGDFEIVQKGAGPFVGNSYGIDRWRNGVVGSSLSTTRQTFTVGQTDVPGNPACFARCVVTSVAGAANLAAYIQFIEGVRTLAGKQATLTFWAKAEAPKNMSAELNQTFGTGGSADVQAIDPQKVALTTVWQKFSLVFNMPSIAGKVIGTGDKLVVNLWFDAGSNHDARTVSLGQQSGTFDIAHVSLVEGDARDETDPFSPRHIQQERMLCGRYLRKLPLNNLIANGTGTVAGSVDVSDMRAIPSVSLTQALTVSDVTTQLYTQSAAAVSITSSTTVDSGPIRLTFPNFSGLPTQRPLAHQTNGGMVLADAEL